MGETISRVKKQRKIWTWKLSRTLFNQKTTDSKRGKKVKGRKEMPVKKLGEGRNPRLFYGSTRASPGKGKLALGGLHKEEKREKKKKNSS